MAFFSKKSAFKMLISAIAVFPELVGAAKIRFSSVSHIVSNDSSCILLKVLWKIKGYRVSKSMVEVISEYCKVRFSPSRKTVVLNSSSKHSFYYFLSANHGNFPSILKINLVFNNWKLSLSCLLFDFGNYIKIWKNVLSNCLVN